MIHLYVQTLTVAISRCGVIRVFLNFPTLFFTIGTYYLFHYKHENVLTVFECVSEKPLTAEVTVRSGTIYGQTKVPPTNLSPFLLRIQEFCFLIHENKSRSNLGLNPEPLSLKASPSRRCLLFQ